MHAPDGPTIRHNLGHAQRPAPVAKLSQRIQQHRTPAKPRPWLQAAAGSCVHQRQARAAPAPINRSGSMHQQQSRQCLLQPEAIRDSTKSFTASGFNQDLRVHALALALVQGMFVLVPISCSIWIVKQLCHLWFVFLSCDEICAACAVKQHVNRHQGVNQSRSTPCALLLATSQKGCR
jgi:hypothetical protein